MQNPRLSPDRLSWTLHFVKIPRGLTCLFEKHCLQLWASQVALVVKNLPISAGDLRDGGSIPGLGRSPREGNGNPLQYSCLKNSMDRAVWQATVHGVAESWTRLSD